MKKTDTTNSARVSFHDNRDLEQIVDLDLAYGPVEKIGPLMSADRPSDLGYMCCFAGTVAPLDDGRWRLYHSVYGQGSRIAVAESADGLRWDKPALGQNPWQGQDTNHLRIEGLDAAEGIIQPQVVRLDDGGWRIYFWLHGWDRGMVRFVAADSADGLHFRVRNVDRPCLFHPMDREVGGVSWTAGLVPGAEGNGKFDHLRTYDFMEAKRLRSNDATFVYRDPRTGEFEMYSVWLMPNDAGTGCQVSFDNAPGARRTLHRRTSEDGLAWSDPELILTPDEHDPRHMQFYHLAVHRAGDWRIGLLGHYRCWEQTMDMELAFSRDGRHWLRPLRGGWIPRGGPDAIDAMSIYPTSRFINLPDGRLLLLYDGHNQRHDGKLPDGVTEKRRAVMGAVCRPGRFAGLATRPRTVGRITLKPFILGSDEIRVDADIRGSVLAELCDPYGRPLPGYGMAESVPLIGDSDAHVLRWQGDRTPAPYRYDAVMLVLEAKDATVYGVER